MRQAFLRDERLLVLFVSSVLNWAEDDARWCGRHQSGAGERGALEQTQVMPGEQPHSACRSVCLPDLRSCLLLKKFHLVRRSINRRRMMRRVADSGNGGGAWRRSGRLRHPRPHRHRPATDRRLAGRGLRLQDRCRGGRSRIRCAQRGPDSSPGSHCSGVVQGCQ